jgi:hypothetical protein
MRLVIFEHADYKHLASLQQKRSRRSYRMDATNQDYEELNVA